MCVLYTLPSLSDIDIYPMIACNKVINDVAHRYVSVQMNLEISSFFPIPYIATFDHCNNTSLAAATKAEKIPSYVHGLYYDGFPFVDADKDFDAKSSKTFYRDIMQKMQITGKDYRKYATFNHRFKINHQ